MKVTFKVEFCGFVASIFDLQKSTNGHNGPLGWESPLANTVLLTPVITPKVETMYEKPFVKTVLSYTQPAIKTYLDNYKT